MIRGRVWGAVHLARRAQTGPFQQRDADALSRLTGPIAQGIRASLRFDAARRITGVDAPGLVVRDANDEVELITAPAHELLASIRTDGRSYANQALPTAVIALSSFVRAGHHRASGAANIVTVPGADGWLTLHASLPDVDHADRVAIVIERATGARSATVRLEASGVTAREREVATLLARGLSKAEIAATLVLSPHTVQDHVKSLYEKVGVASRQELVARVFLDEYLPEVIDRTPLTSRGRFDETLA